MVLTGERRDVASFDPNGTAGLIDPSRLLVATSGDRKDALWSIETSLRSGAANVVMGVLDRGPDLTESRRLMLAAEAGGTTCLLTVREPVSNCAAETRWRARFAPVESFESSRLVCELYKNKRGTSGMVFDVRVERQTGDGGLPAAPAPRPSEAGGPTGR
ncbi:ImuA family protein [Parvularcula dongshanensis]|uniref:ImuA family protein n=1 Tax=Parvularcula dongshanensis TaxID=1173995 RepID=UPI00160D9ECD|nr:hypothetical protein [Parvularcula dongshanensis]